MKTHYQRRLPHILPAGAIVFFTFRLAGSIPAVAWQQLLNEREAALRKASVQAAPADTSTRPQKRHFAACDALLDQAKYGPT